MTRTPSLCRAVAVLLGLAALLATAGCVNLPANTSASVTGNPVKDGNGADVRIWPQGPQRGTKLPEQAVEGFVQTAASDPSNYSIARAYLTGDALADWHPNRVVVFSEVSSPLLVSGTPGAASVQVEITGTMVATVADNGAYQQVADPVKAPYTFDLSYDQDKGYYQIDKLPTDQFGILLTQEAFRANYAAYYLYYVSHDKQTSSMIPVPDYQRSQTGDALTAQNLVSALLTGPPPALSGVAGLAAQNVDLGQVTISADDTASVPVKNPNNCATQGRSACELLADELLATFSSLASVSRVALVDSQGNPLLYSSTVDSLASRYHIAASPDKNTSFYYLDAKNQQVYRYDSASSGPNSSVDQIGPTSRKYSHLAVGFAKGQTFAAAVDSKGSNLYVAAPGSPKDSAPDFVGHRIVSPTWDALGDLWFLDFVGATPSLYRLDYTAEPKPILQQVTILDGENGVISGIAAAPDGQRIAITYAAPGTAAGPPLYTVGIATVTDTPSGLEVNPSFGLDQPVVYNWTSVLDVTWHGSQALAVLGSASSSSPLTISELNSDGSPVINAAADLNPVTFNPPTGTNSIEWTGASLLAGTQSGSGASTVKQIEQYSSTTSTWTLDATGSSPTYVN